ncbi:MAG TPA: hypothetical protein VFD39_07405, partial [Trueperaceae bacterium]|nr:hypothetical protein [Trueperaceae bacterium]
MDSAALGAPLRYRLCLPDVGSSSLSNTPLLLLLHGSGGDERSWDPGLTALQQAVAQGRLPPVAAVAPCTSTSWWVDGREAVESAVMGELLPHLADQQSLGLGGRLVAG